MTQEKTPHKIAAKIAQDNVDTMRRGSTNDADVGGGVVMARLFFGVISGHASICAACARLAVDEEKKLIGCSADFNSPSNQARQAHGGVFLHELQCGEFIRLTDDMEVFIDEDGVTRYNFKKSKE